MVRTINTRTTTTTIQTKSFWTPCSIIFLSCSIFIILSVVITGICVNFLVEDPLSHYILIGLILVLLVGGGTAVIILEVHRRISAKKTKVTRNGRTETHYDFEQPSAPPLSTPSTWSYKKDTFSNQSTLTA